MRISFRKQQQPVSKRKQKLNRELVLFVLIDKCNKNYNLLKAKVEKALT